MEQQAEPEIQCEKKHLQSESERNGTAQFQREHGLPAWILHCLEREGFTRWEKATCTFNMDNFSSTGYYPLTISIAGVGEVTRENAVRVK
jgi:hypothetical protein